MDDIDGGVAAVTASLGHCFISIQQFTVWQLFVATLLSFNVERYSDVRATSDEESDLSEFYGYTMASDELESLTGIPWKLRLRPSDGKGRGIQVHSRMSEEYLGIGRTWNGCGDEVASAVDDKGNGDTDDCECKSDEGSYCVYRKRRISRHQLQQRHRHHGEKRVHHQLTRICVVVDPPCLIRELHNTRKYQ